MSGGKCSIFGLPCPVQQSIVAICWPRCVPHSGQQGCFPFWLFFIQFRDALVPNIDPLQNGLTSNLAKLRVLLCVHFADKF